MPNNLDVLKTYSLERLNLTIPALAKYSKTELKDVLDKFDMELFLELMRVFIQAGVTKNEDEYRKSAALFLEKTKVPVKVLSGVMVWYYHQYYDMTIPQV